MLWKFEWLWSDADTVLFKRKGLLFSRAVIKLQEPIKVVNGKFTDTKVNDENGSIKISEEKNFECKLSDFTEFYVEDDILISYSEKWNRIEQSKRVNLTEDFSFLIQNDELAGIFVSNASKHILPDGCYVVDDVESTNNHFVSKLSEFLSLIERMDCNLMESKEIQIKNELMNIYTDITLCSNPQYTALKETIMNVLE